MVQSVGVAHLGMGHLLGSTGHSHGWAGNHSQPRYLVTCYQSLAHPCEHRHSVLIVSRQPTSPNVRLSSSTRLSSLRVFSGSAKAQSQSGYSVSGLIAGSEPFFNMLRPVTVSFVRLANAASKHATQGCHVEPRAHTRAVRTAPLTIDSHLLLL
mgnify:CR=1 FL=1